MLIVIGLEGSVFDCVWKNLCVPCIHDIFAEVLNLKYVLARPVDLAFTVPAINHESCYLVPLLQCVDIDSEMMIDHADQLMLDQQLLVIGVHFEYFVRVRVRLRFQHLLDSDEQMRQPEIIQSEWRPYRLPLRHRTQWLQ